MRNLRKLILGAALAAALSGCVRLVGTTGYWYKGAHDEEPKSKQVTLDTQDLVQPGRAKGSITMGEDT